MREAIYTPDRNSRRGLGVWKEMGTELWWSRELVWRLLLRDLSARYRQAVLGVFWAVLLPLVSVAVFTYLNHRQILAVASTPIPYPAYVFLTMSVWQLFASGMIAATGSLVAAGGMITKINFTREAVVFASLAQAVFEFLIRLGLLAFVFLVFQVVPAWTIMFLPLALLPLILLCLGFGFILSLVNAIIRDTANAVGPLLFFAMFVTPVVYPPPTQWPQVLLNYVNPVSPVVIAAVDLATRGRLTQPFGLAMSLIFSLIIFLGGWRVFHLAGPRIAERI